MGCSSGREALENPQDFLLDPRSKEFLTRLLRRGGTDIVSPTDPEPTTPRSSIPFPASASTEFVLSNLSLRTFFLQIYRARERTITSLMMTGFISTPYSG
jgi:hypothetical protein